MVILDVVIDPVRNLLYKLQKCFLFPLSIGKQHSFSSIVVTLKYHIYNTLNLEFFQTIFGHKEA